MEIKTAGSDKLELNDAINDIRAALSGTKPSILIIGFNAIFSADKVNKSLEEAFSCPILGGTSCKGSLCISPSLKSHSATIAVLAIEDPAGNYGVGHHNVDDNPVAAAQKALDMALYASGRGYESPTLIWCVLPPGQEEDILEGFADVVGHHVPVFGGSSADNEVAGQWQQMTDISSGSNQISVAVFYPSSQLGASFSSGYEPTDIAFEISAAEGRQIERLNNENAAVAYNRETGNSINDYVAGGNVLALTTLHPLGKKIEGPEDTLDYLLVHPDAITSEGAINVFANVDNEQSLQLMHGSKQTLLKRAKRVIKTAISLLPPEKKPSGILMIYCAGCMLTVEEQMKEMLEDLQTAFPALPIFGLYTFGEQGCFLDGVSRHGNLMISAVAFSA